MKWMPATEIRLVMWAALACGASYWNESGVSIPATGVSRSLLLTDTGAVLANQLLRVTSMTVVLYMIWKD